jgi:hypothetical protein
MSLIATKQLRTSIRDTVRAATTIPLTYAAPTPPFSGTLTALANGALVVDGVTNLVAGDRIGVVSEISPNLPYNGIYTLTTQGDITTKWVLTRSVDADTSEKVGYGTIFFVAAGVANAGVIYCCVPTANPFTLNTDALPITIFNSVTPISHEQVLYQGNLPPPNPIPASYTLTPSPLAKTYTVFINGVLQQENTAVPPAPNNNNYTMVNGTLTLVGKTLADFDTNDTLYVRWQATS